MKGYYTVSSVRRSRRGWRIFTVGGANFNVKKAGLAHHPALPYSEDEHFPFSSRQDRAPDYLRIELNKGIFYVRAEGLRIYGPRFFNC